MKIRHFYIPLLLLSCVISLKAQQPVKMCGTDELRSILKQQNPAQFHQQDQWHHGVAQAANRSVLGIAKNSEVKYKIPVVFHLLHMNGPENISKAQIESQIAVLNEDFQRMMEFEGQSYGVGVEFFLAKCDPLGQPTTGIIRYFTPFTHHSLSADSNLGSTTLQLTNNRHWPPDRYFNVWVVKEINSDGAPILAYVFGVGGSNPSYPDGAVVTAKHLGRVGATKAPYDQGRTLTHEAGHWLGLYHPFDGGCPRPGDPCDATGDRVCDTPPTAAANFKCPESDKIVNTCTTDVPDKPDLLDNYMDYTPDRCMRLFTPGQVKMMHYVLDNYRKFIHDPGNIRFTSLDCVTSTAENIESASFQIYPNPFNESITVETDEPIEKVAIYNLNGQLMLSKASNQTLYQLNTAELPAGLYFVTITAKGIHQHFKVIK
jgi:hypothetical protein